MEAPNKDGQKLPMLTPKNPDGSQRVIKQIMVIDPNKLRVAGLDLKMAEALKKAKVRTTGESLANRSKGDKLALAKSILNKKLKQAQMTKESNKHTTLSPTWKTMEAKTISANKHVPVASLSSLMTKPLVTTPNKPHTVLLNIVKPSPTGGLLEISLKNQSPLVEYENPEHNHIPKASIRDSREIKNEIVKITESKIISPEVRFEMKKRTQSGDNTPVKRAAQLSHNHLAKIIESKVLSPEEKIDVSILRGKSSTQVVSAAVPLAISKKRVNHQKASIESPKSHTINIASKVKEGVPRRKVEPESYPPEPVMDVPSSIPSQAVKEESAVDFISSLLFKFDEKSKENTNLAHVEVKKEPEEDATSFLMSLFGQQTQPSLPTPSKSALVALKVAIKQPLPIEKTSESDFSQPLAESKREEVIKVSTEQIRNQKQEPSPSKGKQYTKTKEITLSESEDVPAIIDQSTEEKLLESMSDTSETKSVKKVEAEKLSLQENILTNTIQIVPQSFSGIEKSFDFNDGVQRHDIRDSSSNTSNTSLIYKKNEDSLTEKSSKTKSTIVGLYESTKSPSKIEPKAEEIMPSTTTSNTRRKGKKSVPVLIAKLNRNRKAQTSQEKPLEKASHTSKGPSELSSTADGNSSEIKVLSSVPSEESPLILESSTKELEQENQTPQNPENLIEKTYLAGAQQTTQDSMKKNQLDIAESPVLNEKAETTDERTTETRRLGSLSLTTKSETQENVIDDRTPLAIETEHNSRKVTQKAMKDLGPTMESADKIETAITSPSCSKKGQRAVIPSKTETIRPTTKLQTSNTSESDTNSRPNQENSETKKNILTQKSESGQSSNMEAEKEATQSEETITTQRTSKRKPKSSVVEKSTTENAVTPPPVLAKPRTRRSTASKELTSPVTPVMNVESQTTAVSTQVKCGLDDSQPIDVNVPCFVGSEVPVEVAEKGESKNIPETQRKSPECVLSAKRTRGAAQRKKVEDQTFAAETSTSTGCDTATKSEKDDTGKFCSLVPSAVKEIEVEEGVNIAKNKGVEKSTSNRSIAPTKTFKVEECMHGPNVSSISTDDRNKVEETKSPSLIEPAGTTTSTSQPKRSSRFKKGKINLVERKKLPTKKSDPKETKTEERSGLEKIQLKAETFDESSKNISLPTSGSVKIVDESDRCDENDADFTSANLELNTKPSAFAASVDNSPKQGKAKNPFKQIKPTEKDDPSNSKQQAKKIIDDSEETGFLGFNEKEIEEGQQSASLRLSQSEEVETFQLKSSSTSSSKKKSPPPIKKAFLGSGKKQRTEQTNWKKTSAASLKNWLMAPDRESAATHTEEKSANDVTEMTTNKREISSESIKLDESGILLQERDNNLIEPENMDTTKQDESDLCTTIESVASGKGKDKKLTAKKITSQVEILIKKDAPRTSESKSASTAQLQKRKATSVDKDDSTTAQEQSPSTSGTRKSTKASSKREKIKPKSEKDDKNVCETILLESVADTKTPSRKRSSAVLENKTPSLEPPAKLSHLSEVMYDAFTPPSVKRRGRKPKCETSTPRMSKSTYIAAPPVSPLEKKYKNDTEFNPRLLIIRKKEDLKTDTPLVYSDMQTVCKNKDDVQCALCMGFTAKKKWVQHVSEHYGIGWTVGSPPPLNVKSRASVLNYMVEFFKTSKVKGLNCRLCQGQRRSALGLLIHLEQCCLTEDELKESRVVCEHCNNNYSRTSISIHWRTCTVLQRKSKIQDENEPKVDEAPTEEEVLSNTGRLKRKSVIQAENKFKSLNDADFIPDELIKHIPVPRKDLHASTWLREIQTFGKGFCVQKKCPFTAATVEELFRHCQENVCTFHVQPGYWCMKCKFHESTIEPVRAHIILKHNPKPVKDFEDSEDEAVIDSGSSSESGSSGDEELEEGTGNEEQGEEQKSKKKKKSKKVKRSKPQKNTSTKDFKRLLPDREQNIASLVAHWHDIFIQKNYTANALYTFAKPSEKQPLVDGCESYFPKSPISMKFVLNGFNGFVKEFGKASIEPNQWQYLERMAGVALPTEHTLYIGGPVKDIAWVPLEPHPEVSVQYLASITRKGIDKFSRYLQPKRSRSVVYIHKYCTDDSSDLRGEIHYAMAIDSGPAHCIEFLPSGGYAREINRLGLLAIGTVETEIKIYSLPLEVEKRDCDIFPILQIEPSLVLCLEITENSNEFSQEYQSQCMDLVWSKSAGHNYIIAGYLNGFIAIWDISDDEDNLNRFLVNRVRKFVPVSYFWTNEDRIKQIAAHYDMNGFRWLAVCNSPRRLVIYDLRDINRPVVFYEDTTKNVCSSVDWPVVWENPSYGVGDAMPSHGCCINTVSPLSLVFGNRRFDKFCCGVNDIHFNVWRNVYAAGANNGDIHITSLREANLDVGLRLKYDEKVISSLDIVPLDGSTLSQKTSQKLPDGWRLFDADYKDKYGLVFGTMQKIMGSKKPELYSTKRIPPLNLTRMMRVSRLQFNPNRKANSLLAVGYDNGFLRVLRSDLHKATKQS